MEKEKYYYMKKFPLETIQEAYNLFYKKIEKKENFGVSSLKVKFDNETWNYDFIEDFFLNIQTRMNIVFNVLINQKRKKE